MDLPTTSAPIPQCVCRVCGTPIAPGRRYCRRCVRTISKENLVEVARSGRAAAQTPEAQARRAATKHRHDISRQGWLPSSLPAWLDNECYTTEIQPMLAGFTVSPQLLMSRFLTRLTSGRADAVPTRGTGRRFQGSWRFRRKQTGSRGERRPSNSGWVGLRSCSGQSY